MVYSTDDLPKPSVAQMEQRPESVDSLFTATMIGIKDNAPKNVGSLVKDDGSNQNWANAYLQIKEQLEHQSAGGGAKSAQAKIMMDQLEMLNKMTATQRSAYLLSLNSTDGKINGIGKVQDDVRSKLMYSKPQAIGKQGDAVSLADQVDEKTLKSEADSIEGTIAHNHDASLTPFLNTELHLTRAAMAAPFTERVRLAAMQLQDGRAVQAEHTLEDALKANIPAEAWSDPALTHLRDDARDRHDELHVQNNLLTLFDETVARLSKITGRQDISRSDFSAPILKDPQFGALSKFLSRNYDTLTKGQFFNNGITRSEIQSYVNERNKNLNDFVD